MGRPEPGGFLWDLTERHATPTGGSTSLNPPFSAFFALWCLAFSDCGSPPPRRLIPNVSDGFETRGIGPGAECGRTMNALSEDRQRPAREQHPEAVRFIKSASRVITALGLRSLISPIRPIPNVAVVSKRRVFPGRGIQECWARTTGTCARRAAAEPRGTRWTPKKRQQCGATPYNSQFRGFRIFAPFLYLRPIPYVSADSQLLALGGWDIVAMSTENETWARWNLAKLHGI